MTMDNYLALEGLLIARLRDQIPDIPSQGVKDLAGVKTLALPNASLFVYLVGDHPGETADLGANQQIRQSWTVEVVVRNTFQAATGAGARQEAGPLLAQVIRALSGWTPDFTIYRALYREKSEVRPGYSDDGFLFYPLQFAVNFVFTV